MSPTTLLFVAGASPQIITETVAALLAEDMRIGEVHVLTTETGRRLIADALWAREAHWKRLVTEYPAARRCRFSRRSIHVLEGENRKPLSDVRTPGENLAVADQIVRFVERHTGPESPPLHASIAGGRKTMGYLLAAAMMLHGRPEDCLSHVLVRPADLEGTDFFFRPQNRRGGVLRHRRPDGSPVKVPLAEVRVDLARLPFLRLRGLRDPNTLRGAKFSALVAQLQGDLDLVSRPSLAFAPERRVIVCGGREVKLSAERFELYRLLAERRKSGCGVPACSGCPSCFVPSEEIGADFRARLRERLGARDSMGAGERWGLEDFRSQRSKIRDALRRRLRAAADLYEIRHWGERGSLSYGLVIDPSLIDLEAG